MLSSWWVFYLVLGCRPGLTNTTLIHIFFNDYHSQKSYVICYIIIYISKMATPLSTFFYMIYACLIDGYRTLWICMAFFFPNCMNDNLPEFNMIH